MGFGTVSNGGGTMPQMDGTYVLTVLRVEDGGEGQFGPRMRWVFSCTDEDGDNVTWDDGTPFELWQSTGTSLGPKGKARKWAEAVLQRELVNGENGDEIVRQMVGKRVRALIQTNEAGYAGIVGMTPMRDKKRQPAAEPF